MDQISKSQEPQKNLITILKKHSGRDNSGQVSIRHQGGRQKRYYRTVDFKRDKRNIEGTVIGFEYDPNRNSQLALIEYKDKEKRYILRTKDMKTGDKIIASDAAEIKTGNALKLKNVPLGISVHNVELYPGQGGQIIRGAGTYASVIAKEGEFVHLKMPSGEVRRVPGESYATIGQIGNIEFKERNLRKAGRSRLLGIRPTVRGTAQNPRSHPHGGGEGRVGEGMIPKTPWGKLARGGKTRKPGKWTNKLIIKRRK